MNDSVRTRFAPSPTGSLHVGNARIAILNWLVARHHDGAFILRVEDTDVERNVGTAERSIIEDLRWLGLDWDEGPDEGGPVGPYRQSERLDLYRQRAEGLRAAGHAYRCFCTPAELDARRQAAIQAGKPPHYDGSCLALDDAASDDRAARGEEFTLRFHVAPGDAVRFHDAARGDITVERADIGDFVILRSDGRPTYNFAVVVDDDAMAVTHVIRGAGHLSNTPRQALLFDALGADRPVFVHVPTVLGEDRSKLSKRHGARALDEYRRAGLHPDAVVNYLSLLAWSSPSEDEVLDRERLVREIDLGRVRTADVVFDEDKLRWLSGKHIEAMPLDDLVRAVEPYLDPRAPVQDRDALRIAVDAVRSHITAFGDIRGLLTPFRPGLDDDGRRDRDRMASDPANRRVLETARQVFEGTGPWTPDAIKGVLQAVGDAADARGAALYVPVRVAVTGQPHGPPLHAVLAVQGRDAVLAALDAALSRESADGEDTV